VIEKEARMKKLTGVFLAVFVCCSPVAVTYAVEHSLGIGVHYFYTLQDIKNDFNEEFGGDFHRDGIACNVSYRFKPNPHFGLLLELQDYPNGYYAAKSAYSPRVLVLLGKSLYIGAGAAWNHLDWENDVDPSLTQDNWSNTYYLLRAGFDWPFIVEDLKIELSTTYEFNNWSEIKDIDTDLLTFGAGLRVIL
jgi:opacity protein-like surface antigen